ncbi:RNA polymerase sigma factor [Synoicihabitans lomoniglobus]|uniref:Sigma-70 family RNA polymerase sigma factor n=1 Tax=Synoicihabitans lomoniglobus TaxID=2909285 RepID=A0AAE9ZXV5_9BACT|nr:sigma-70 family RNA polymerase sigma factor [Opitutaceae bacterium LMO-M01]WED64568.1 sigma-70 family RNA polymerase sigma factor [Opitutaceae bacterium LMO-M01]
MSITSPLADSAPVTTTESASPLRTRGSLLFRLRDWRDMATWREFYGLYRNYVYRVARGAGLTHHEAEDLIHDVFQRVAEKIGDFEHREQRGSFRRWLGNQTRWRIADKLRERRRVPGIGGDSSPPFSGGDGATSTGTPLLDRIPAAGINEDEHWDREWQKQLLESAMTRLGRKVSPQHLQVFQLHRERGWSLVKVSRELGVGLASVYAINSRLTKQLKAEVARLRTHIN